MSDRDEETGSVGSSEDSGDEQLNAACRDEDWEDWEGGGSDDDEDVTQSLFGPERLPNPEAAMAHDAATHGFDLKQYAIKNGLDEYDIIRIINFIRTEVKAGRDPRDTLAASSSGGARPWADDAYLRPVLEDDALLCYDFEEVAAAAAAHAAAAGGSDAGPSAVGGLSGASGAAAAELERLREENEALRAALLAMRNEFLPEELREGGDGASTSDGRAEEATKAAAEAGAAAAAQVRIGTEAAAAAAATAAAEADGGDPEAAAAAAIAAARAKKVDAAYFDSYSYFDIHRDMLGDKPRTEAYRDALERNPSLLRGATVLDVGCGTGILSLFACRAGAQRVVAVDGSERIASFARRHAELAGYADSKGGPMSVVVGKLEELGDRMPLQRQQADVLVSEWMGYALLFETMLDTVLHARDLYLKPGGAMLPDRANIYIAGATSAAGGLNFWRDVYGFNMTPVAEAIAEAGHGQAVVMAVKQEDLVTSTACVKELDLCTMRPEDQDFTAEFKLELLPPAAASTQASEQQAQAAQQPEQPQQPEMGCVVLWFDTPFSSRHCRDHPVLLSTSPYDTTTHWAQTLLTLRKPVPLMVHGAGDGGNGSGAGAGATQQRPGAREVTGRVSMVRSRSQFRSLDIALQYRAVLSDGSVVEDAQLYHMNVMTPS